MVGTEKIHRVPQRLCFLPPLNTTSRTSTGWTAIWAPGSAICARQCRLLICQHLQASKRCVTIPIGELLYLPYSSRVYPMCAPPKHVHEVIQASAARRCPSTSHRYSKTPALERKEAGQASAPSHGPASKVEERKNRDVGHGTGDWNHFLLQAGRHCDDMTCNYSRPGRCKCTSKGTWHRSPAKGGCGWLKMMKPSGMSSCEKVYNIVNKNIYKNVPYLF